MDGPTPPLSRLVKSGVFLPRFLGISKKALWPTGRVGMQGSQGGVGAHLVDEYQAFRVDAAEFLAP
jgi:hypothetical protein